MKRSQGISAESFKVKALVSDIPTKHTNSADVVVPHKGGGRVLWDFLVKRRTIQNKRDTADIFADCIKISWLIVCNHIGTV